MSTPTCTSAKGYCQTAGLAWKSESEDDSSWMRWQHVRQLSEIWRVWQLRDKAGYEWQGRLWVRGSRMYAGFRYVLGMTAHTCRDPPAIAHGLTVKLSPCQCSHSLAGWIAECLCGHPKYNLLLAQACPKMIQHLSTIPIVSWYM